MLCSRYFRNVLVSCTLRPWNIIQQVYACRRYAVDAAFPLRQENHMPSGLVFINNIAVNGTSANSIDVKNPATNETIACMQLSDTNQVNEAVQSSLRAFTEWSQMAPLERAEKLSKVADLIDKRVDELAVIDSMDAGKPRWEARLDVKSCVDTFRYFAGLAATVAVMGQHIPIEYKYGSYASVIREPLGVCGGIGAWNHPFLIASWKSAAALSCGNTMVYKPSPLAPLSPTVLARIFQAAGLPAGCFNVVQGEAEVGEALCTHRDVAKISFTGSVGTGKRIMELCSRSLKKLTLELGGKSPLIVCEDAPVQNAVTGTLLANFLSSGQVCSNGTRVFVHEKIYDEFVAKLVERVRRLRVGNPLAADTDVGATISRSQLNKVLEYVQIGKSEGAELLCGGERLHLGEREAALRDGNFMQPAVFGSVQDAMSIAREEIFGIVVSLLRYSDDDEVVARVNNNEHGLAAGVFTRNLYRANRLSARLQAGNVWVNCFNNNPPTIPFGGCKMSGFGRENGTAVVENYTQLKTVLIDLTPELTDIFDQKNR